MNFRRVIGVTILALWVGAIAFHVRREYFRSEALVLAEGAQRLAPGTFFYTVRMDGQAIGMASSRLDTTDAGFLFQDLLQLDIPAMDTLHRATVRTRATLGEALDLRSFEFRLDSEIGDFHVTGEATSDSTLSLSLDAGQRDQTVTLPLDRSLTLPVALPLRMAASGRLDVGQEYSARVFDPSAMSDRTVTVEVTGRDNLVVVDSVAQAGGSGRWRPAGYDTIPVWVVEERYGGVSVRSWLDEDGRLVRAESPMGFTMERAPFELARQEWRLFGADPASMSGYGSVIENTAIAANADLTGIEHDVRALVVRLQNVELEGFDLEGGRQTLRGDTLTVRRESLSALEANYSLPYQADEEMAQYLESTPLIQADHPRIVETARRVAGGASEPAAVARRLTDWVYDTLDKDITLSVPSAVQVLEMGVGDCNEHTVLYVALARALGLPTRTAVGLVHINGRFYYHAWPEVWLDEWVAVDPTLGQYPADASHLRFLVGGLARQVELIRLIGRLQLDIIRTVE